MPLSDSARARNSSLPNGSPRGVMNNRSSAIRSSTVATSPELVAFIQVSTSSRIARSSSASAIPSLLADQRHKPHPAQILLAENPVFLLGHLDQLLNSARVADWHDQPPAWRELS